MIAKMTVLQSNGSNCGATKYKHIVIEGKNLNKIHYLLALTETMCFKTCFLWCFEYQAKFLFLIYASSRALKTPPCTLKESSCKLVSVKFYDFNSWWHIILLIAVLECASLPQFQGGTLEYNMSATIHHLGEVVVAVCPVGHIFPDNSSTLNVTCSYDGAAQNLTSWLPPNDTLICECK